MNNEIANNGYYVPQSGGTSIASLIQNKNNSDGNNNNGNGNNMGMTPSTFSGMEMRGSAQPMNLGYGSPYYNNPGQYSMSNMNGYVVDENGYPIRINREEPIINNNTNMINSSLSSVSGLSYDIRSKISRNNDTISENERIMKLANDVNNSLDALDRKDRHQRRKKKNKNNTSKRKSETKY